MLGVGPTSLVHLFARPPLNIEGGRFKQLPLTTLKGELILAATRLLAADSDNHNKIRTLSPWESKNENRDFRPTLLVAGGPPFSPECVLRFFALLRIFPIFSKHIMDAPVCLSFLLVAFGWQLGGWQVGGRPSSFVVLVRPDAMRSLLSWYAGFLGHLLGIGPVCVNTRGGVRGCCRGSGFPLRFSRVPKRIDPCEHFASPC